MDEIAIDLILPNPEQPRTIFDEDELNSLAATIKEVGLIQPIVVERVQDHYIIIDGERRWRAHQIAGLETIKATVQAADKKNNSVDRLTQALVANIQRSSMGFVDEAKAYQRLMEEFGTVDAVATKTGMSTATISGRLSLLELAPGVQHMYNLKKLPFDLSILAVFRRLKNDEQESLASMAVSRGWKTTSILRAGHRMLSQKGKAYTPITRQAKEIPIGKGKFDALSMLKILAGDERNLAPNLISAARATCKACALYQEASPKVCNQCPLPDCLNRASKMQ